MGPESSWTRNPLSESPANSAAEALAVRVLFAATRRRPGDDRREVGHAGVVEEGRQGGRQEGDEQQLGEAEDAGDPGDGDGAEEDGATEVGHHHDRAPSQPINPRSRRKAHEQQGDELEDPERRDLEWAGAEHDDRRQRHCRPGDVRADSTRSMDAAHTRTKAPSRQIEAFISGSGGSSGCVVAVMSKTPRARARTRSRLPTPSRVEPGV